MGSGAENVLLISRGASKFMMSACLFESPRYSHQARKFYDLRCKLEPNVPGLSVSIGSSTKSHGAQT
jgi:hypothetical protein